VAVVVSRRFVVSSFVVHCAGRFNRLLSAGKQFWPYSMDNLCSINESSTVGTPNITQSELTGLNRLNSSELEVSGMNMDKVKHFN